jgi:hypothetical protein
MEIEKLECPRCHRILEKTTKNFFIRINEIEPYWQGKKPLGCKECYKEYRKELRLRNKEKLKNPIAKIEEELTKTITKAKEGDWDNFQNTIEEFLKPLGCELLGTGLDRIVYSIGKDFALKIQKGSNKQNQVEVENYKKILKLSEDVRKYFIPLLAWDKKDYNWILVPKVKTFRNGLTEDKARSIENFLVNKFTTENIYVSDVRYVNIGIYKNEPVLIDYGYFTLDKKGRLK